MEEKKNYAHIEFKHFNLDYDFCICPFDEIQKQLECIDADFQDADEKRFQEFGKPEIIVNIISMTDSEYEAYLVTCQDDND